jgi:hypothetical protein
LELREVGRRFFFLHIAPYLQFRVFKAQLFEPFLLSRKNSFLPVRRVALPSSEQHSVADAETVRYLPDRLGTRVTQL